MGLLDHVPLSQNPYWTRPDLTPFLIHLTKSKDDGTSAFDNLVNILQEGRIRGTKEMVQGPRRATCFMDVPFIALKYICTKDNKHRYEPYGIIVTKESAYDQGVRPVLYLSDEERRRLAIPERERWRVVKYGKGLIQKVDWLHEREWRCSGNFDLPPGFGVLVKTVEHAKQLEAELTERPDDFTSMPQTIIPLVIVCQGLVY